MNELQIFNNSEFGQVRMVKIKGKDFAVGIDIARALKYARPSEAITDHCKGTVKHRIGVQTGDKSSGLPAMQEIEMNVIPVGDVYRLIVKAADQSISIAVKEKAEQFERWIFDEVLVSIHKTGKYETPDFLAKMHDSIGKIRGLSWHATPTVRKQHINENLAKLREYYHSLVDIDAKSEPNPMSIFMQERCIINQESIIERTPLYNNYVMWCYGNNVYPKSKIKLTEYLGELDEVAYLSPDGKNNLNARFMGIELIDNGLNTAIS